LTTVWWQALNKGLWTALAILSALVLLPVENSGAGEDQLSLTTSPRSFARFGAGAIPPGLTFLGGLTLTSDHPDFGGFSGLEVSPDGKRFVSVSDGGNWFTGRFVYENGRLTDIADARLAPILNSKGKAQPRGSRSDAEAVAAWNSKSIDGKLMVGFERRQRIEQFNFGKRGVAATPQRLRAPKGLSQGQYNGEVEALGRFAEGPLKGRIIAISERNQTKAGHIRGWLWRGKKSHEFQIPRHEDYLVTGLAILPGGKEVITVERSFTPPVLVGMALRRFSAEEFLKPRTGPGKLVFAGKLTSFQIDNMEGIAAHQDDMGTVITVISDDNFNTSVQSTVVFQFRLN
jgi:hypothetical protein